MFGLTFTPKIVQDLERLSCSIRDVKQVIAQHEEDIAIGLEAYKEVSKMKERLKPFYEQGSEANLAMINKLKDINVA